MTQIPRPSSLPVAAGIVLCGGKSSRMGRPKAWLPFGEELMLPRVVRILREVVSPVVVVAAVNQELPPSSEETLIVRDQCEGRGPLEGLRAGMKELLRRGSPAETIVYATSCDVPLLAADFIRHVVACVGSNLAAVPEEDGFLHPLAAAYRLALLPEIEGLLSAGQLRPAMLFDKVSTTRIPGNDLRAFDSRLDSLKNCNHPEDYEDALRIAGLSGVNF